MVYYHIVLYLFNKYFIDIVLLRQVFLPFVDSLKTGQNA